MSPPIVGLTDRESITPRFPRLGKLKKGGPKTKDGGRGKDLEYFRFVAEKPEVQAVFDKRFGPKPVSLNVYLPYDEVEDAFATWKEKWVAGGMVHRCDGVTMTVWLGADGKYHTDPKPCPYCGLQQTEAQKKADPPCDEMGRLSVVIPELWEAGYVGYVTLETGGKHDLMSINECLTVAQEARGTLKGIRFVLSRELEEVSTPGEGGKRMRRKMWMVKIAPAADWVLLQLQASRQAAMLGPGQAPLGLPAPSAQVQAEAQAKAETGPWQTIPEYQDRFREQIKSLGLTNSEALSALSVSKVGDYEGDFEDAVAALQDYAEWKAAKAEEAARAAEAAENAPPATEAVPAGNGGEPVSA